MDIGKEWRNRHVFYMSMPEGRSEDISRCLPSELKERIKTE